MKPVLLLVLVVVVKCEQNSSEHEQAPSLTTCDAKLNSGQQVIKVVVEVNIPAVQPLQQSTIGSIQNMPAES